MKLDNSEIQLASYHGLRVEVSFPQSSAISNHISNLDVSDTGKIKKRPFSWLFFLTPIFYFLFLCSKILITQRKLVLLYALLKDRHFASLHPSHRAVHLRRCLYGEKTSGQSS